MAKNKRYVYLQLYPKDLLADEKLAKCDKASAWGAYLALLNIMAMEKIRGCVRLRDWDSHPNNERKSLVANFRKANSLRTKAAAFARVVMQRTPLKAGPIAEGIEQLLVFGVVVLHDDALIQPRMFRDSHSVLEGYEPEPEPAEETVEEEGDKGEDAPHEEEKNEEGIAPARTLRANTHTRFENENENNNDNNDSKGNDARKTQKFTPPTLEEVQAYCQEKAFTFDPVMFFNHYEANGWVQGRGKPIRSWQACCNTWQRRESNGEFTNNNSGNNGRKATKNNQRGAYQGAGRNQEQEAAALREQTVRLIERNRAQRAAAQTDGTDTGDDPF